MKKILIGGSGGAPSEGVIYSLKKLNKYELIGIGSDPEDLFTSLAHLKYLVPSANEDRYISSIQSLFKAIRPDFAHFQNDMEIFIISQNRKILDELNVRYFMPEHDVIDTCVHKFKSYLAFKKSGIKVPENKFISSLEDLKKSFSELKNQDGKIWLRSNLISGGGKGSLSTSDFEFAKSWIDNFDGWGSFIAAEMLTERTVTWQSIWYKGELIVAQTRARRGWIHGNRSVSGVTGVTKLGITIKDDLVDEIALRAIYAVDKSPHGIYGVDLAYDFSGIPNPTEINISRFFTTIRFFTEAGLNMPEIFVDIGLGNFDTLPKRQINPIEPGLCWIRGMDKIPTLSKYSEFEEFLLSQSKNDKERVNQG